MWAAVVKSGERNSTQPASTNKAVNIQPRDAGKWSLPLPQATGIDPVACISLQANPGRNGSVSPRATSTR
jgi:hypothetical protein